MDYGIWTILTPIITIVLAIVTRQVFLSLLVGAFFGFSVISHFNFLEGARLTAEGIIDVFTVPSNTKVVLFCFMVGGIIRLIEVSGGTQGIVNALTQKTKLIKGKKTVQLLGVLITAIIFIESSISIMSSGTVTKYLAQEYRVSREKMAYLLQASCVSVCSLVMINAWGATIMGIVAGQLDNQIIQGDAFSIVLHSMPYHLMAWVTLLFVVIYIFFEGLSWGAMKKSEDRAQNGQELREGAIPIVNEDLVKLIEHPKTGSVLNFLIPILCTVLSVPLFLYITGDGVISKGSGSTSVFWAILLGTFVSFIWFMASKMMNMNNFFKHLFDGYANMISLAAIMVLAFLMGRVSGELQTGQYIASVMGTHFSAGFAPAFIFIIACLMSLSTGTSFGTFAIMIPISIQLGVSVDMDIQLMIGAAISGAIFGDMTSPISDTSLVASMATGNDHIDHIRTQFPYAILTGTIVLLLFILFGFLMIN